MEVGRAFSARKPMMGGLSSPGPTNYVRCFGVVRGAPQGVRSGSALHLVERAFLALSNRLYQRPLNPAARSP